MRLLVLVSVLLGSLFALDVRLTSTQIANGKSALLLLSSKDGKEYTKVKIASQSFPLLVHPKDENSFFTLLPMSYYEKPSHKKLHVFYEKDGVQHSQEIALDVVQGEYKKEVLEVESSKVTLSDADKKRTAKEYAEAMKIYKTITPKSYIQEPFKVPLDSFITSEFGKARVYNGSLKGYHSGTDFRAEVGVPIIASNDGVVVLAQERFYAGGSIVIDHGYGIYTTYYHLSKFLVQEGDVVKKSQVIALSGKSGRVTGPHLHFGVRVFGVQVDPLQFITLINQNLFKGIQ
ncbi:MAG: M23 family metallopeptidase [Sulfurimonas sp.]|jgi:murein DD-endopeptidase MepM/ murein hydrolase activator NlpD|nr:M23 family metallopeptidase [Sulfurimonas sp.]